MHRIIVALSVTLLLAACGISAIPTTSGTPQSEVVVQATAAPAPTAAPKPTTTPKPTEAPKPTATPAPTATPEPEKLKLLDSGFGQNKQVIGYAFLVENPNKGLAYGSSQYHVSVYSADGTVLGTDSNYIAVIFPGEKLGVAGRLYLNSEAKAEKIEVQILGGKTETFKEIQGFGTDKVTFAPDPYSPKVAGIVTSSYTKDIKQVYVAAIAYDQAGKIIGGGFTFLDFVPAAGKTAVEVGVTVSDDPAKVELYPTFSELSLQ